MRSLTRWGACIAVVLLAAAAQADNRVVKVSLFDELKPSCGTAGCASGCGCGASTGKPACSSGCSACDGTACSSCQAGACDNGKCRTGKCKGAKCKGGKCQGGECDVCNVCGNGDVCEDGCGKCKKCGCICKNLRGIGKCNVGNMPQHQAYFPPDHGYYYFRPYNYRHIYDHQHAVMRWGGDPRNPYSNAVFQTIFAELEAEGIEAIETEPQIHEAPMAPVAPVPAADGDPAPAPPAPAPPAPAADDTTQVNLLRLIPTSSSSR